MEKKHKINVQDVENNDNKSDFRLDGLIIIALSVVCVILSIMNPAGRSEGLLSLLDPMVFVALILGFTTVKNAIFYLCKGKISSDFLIALAIIATFVLGILVALNEITSDKNYFLISAIFAIVSNVVYFIQKAIFFKAEFNSKILNVKKVRATRKIGNVLAIVAILSALGIFVVKYLLQEDLIKCIETAIFALVLFVPTSITLGSIFSVCSARKRAKKRGVIYTDIAKIEKLARVNTVIFDDDVLIDENYTVEKVLGFDKDKKAVFDFATSIYKKEDAFSRAMTKVSNVQFSVAESQVFEGGAKGVIGNSIVEVCTPRYLLDNYNYDISSIVRTRYKVLFVIENGLVIGAILFGVKTKDCGKKLVADFKALNIKTVLLSANTHSQVEVRQKECGVEEVFSDLTLKDKEYRIVSSKIKNNGDTLFVTNGVEKVGADYLLNLSKCLGDESVDIALDSEKLENAPYSLKILRRVFSKIRFSIILNFVISIGLTALLGLGFIGWMTASAVYILLNLISFLLLR